MPSILEQINQKFLLVEIEREFQSAGFKVSNSKYLLDEKEKKTVKIFLKNGDKVVVSYDSGDIKWKMNGFSKGKILGETMREVAKDYHYHYDVLHSEGFKDYFKKSRGE